MEIPALEGKVSLYQLTDRNRTLSVDDLKIATVTNGPIDDVQRKVICNGVCDSISLFVLVDKLSLLGWQYVELAAVSNDAVLIIVLEAVGQLSDSDFLEFDLHA